ncbi:MAG: LLM class flavin-dependent oxidoreductase [Dehalococcoidia bacterium]
MTIGVAIQAPTARAFVDQVMLAERLGVPTAWSTIGGAGGADTLTSYAVALDRTERITVGTAIVQTWPKHPIAIAQQALALEQLAPGRLILGVGPAHEPAMVRTYGVRWHRPLKQLREYLSVLRALLDEGRAGLRGRTRHRARRACTRPHTALMASALRPASFALCGELADAIPDVPARLPCGAGAAPRSPRAHAARTARSRPSWRTCPLRSRPTAASPVVSPPANASATTRGTPFYLAMFAQAGFADAAEGYSDALLDDLVVSGTEDDVAARLRSYRRRAGAGARTADRGPRTAPPRSSGRFEPWPRRTSRRHPMLLAFSITPTRSHGDISCTAGILRHVVLPKRRNGIHSPWGRHLRVRAIGVPCASRWSTFTATCFSKPSFPLRSVSYQTLNVTSVAGTRSCIRTYDLRLEEALEVVARSDFGNKAVLGRS